MRLTLLLSISLVSVSLVACARNARPVSTDASDPAWTPPGQVDLTIKNTRVTNVAEQKTQAESCRPNKTDIPQKNAVHPVY